MSGCIGTECRLHSQALPEYCQPLVESPECRLVFPVCRFRTFLALQNGKQIGGIGIPVRHHPDHLHGFGCE